MTEGDLQPVSNETDSITLTVNHALQIQNYEEQLEVYYGYMNFADNQAADGAMHSIVFNYENVISLIEVFVDNFIEQLRIKREFIEEINNFEK